MIRFSGSWPDIVQPEFSRLPPSTRVLSPENSLRINPLLPLLLHL